jgi:amino acid adenylation domain-containing protein
VTRRLDALLESSARRHPDRIAVEEPTDRQAIGRITYRELDALASDVAGRLQKLGVRPGDRVGIYMKKSIGAVVAIFGALKAGAAYVPVDPQAPAARNAYILDNCSVRVTIMEKAFAAAFQTEIGALGAAPDLLFVEGTGASLAIDDLVAPPADTAVEPARGSEDLAYILYTSGSTGRPKGVMLSHENALSYVDWCTEVFAPTEDDRFSSHAPFHFDLSILDLFVPIKHGAAVVLVGEELGKDPTRLAAFIAERRLSVWYSVPSILTLVTQYGHLERFDYTALRLVLFAGEVFPVKHLRALQALLPRPAYFNLYGPTETNVCTFYRVPETIAADRAEPFPIGPACSHCLTRVVDEQGSDVAPGGEGELCVAGASVMQGYWSLPEQSARAFLVDASGERWYRTGDIVVEEPGEGYRYVGRRDRMVKRRGYRVELGEIEAGLYRHPSIKEAAVIAAPDAESGVQIRAYLSCHGGDQPSIVELKRFCVEHLPRYMAPDVFFFLDRLPRTSTDKTDYQRLKERV